MKRVTIDPITRLEGHGRIEIFLDDGGDVANVYFQVPELRGFEQFCVGRHAEDMPVLTNRICGVCPEAHHMASVKALDQIFNAPPPPAAQLIRELVFMAFFVTDHTTHFYALGGPDFLIGPDAPPAERNLLGVIRKFGTDLGRQVIDCRARNHHLIERLGGRGIHLVAGLPGGWSRPVKEEERGEIYHLAMANVDFALQSLEIFRELILGNSAYRELLHDDTYMHRTYSMGTVDRGGFLNVFDGEIRVVDPDGKELLKYRPEDYSEHIAERVEEWTYLKFPYLKQVGWKGFVDGPESGVYAATPLTRLNVARGMPTLLAQECFEEFFEAFGSTEVDGCRQPVHHRLATHWARLIEMLYAAERMAEIAMDPALTDPLVRTPPGEIAGEGVGSVEAPRGTLTHHYHCDERGVLTAVNLIVGTTNNHAPISMSLKRAAEKLINGGREIDEGLLNRIEMAFRLYDPCLSCATHSLPGQMPLHVVVRGADGTRLRTLARGRG